MTESASSSFESDHLNPRKELVKKRLSETDIKFAFVIINECDLFCKFCKSVVSAKKKFHLTAHMKTVKHQNNVTRSVSSFLNFNQLSGWIEKLAALGRASKSIVEQSVFGAQNNFLDK